MNELAGRSLSELRLTGTFGLPEMHAWVGLVLPEVPERVPADDEVKYAFRSALLGTILLCTYTKGDAVFRSDNLTTLTTLKDVLTREATQRKVQVRTAFDVNEGTVKAMLDRIHPLLEYQTSLSNQVHAHGATRGDRRRSWSASAHAQVKLLEPLEELVQQEGDTSFLHPEYARALSRAETLRLEHAQMPRQLEYMIGVVADLYMDRQKLKGISGQHQLSALDHMIRTDYSEKALREFFQVA